MPKKVVVELTKLKVLLGFPQIDEMTEVSKIAEDIMKAFSSRGYSAEIVQKFYLPGIELLLSKEDFDCLILQEHIEYKNPISPEYLDKLTLEHPSVENIICIIDDKHERTSYVKKLYDYGIYNAVFDKDADINYIVERCLRKRTKKEAFDYYGLHYLEEKEDVYNNAIPSNILERIIKYLNKVNDKELQDAYDNIVKKYNEKQNIYIVKNLPEDLGERLKNNINYKKFKKILDENSIENDNKFKINIDLPDINISKNNKKVVKEKVIVKKEVVYKTPTDYKKMCAFISPESTGKTEIASNVALSAAKMGKTVALLDLDFEKYGTIYNFNADPGEDNENYHKYRLLFNKVRGYLDGKESELTDKQIKKLALTKKGRLHVYTGCLTIPIFDRKDIEADELIFIIRKLRNIFDLVVLDVGKKLNRKVFDAILELDNIEKFLVTTQNLETLNTIPYTLRFKHDIDYKNWNLIVNMHRRINSLKDSKITDFFYDEDLEHLKYEIKDIFYIPYNEHVFYKKGKRKYVYGEDEEFDRSVDEIVTKTLSVQKKKGLLDKIKGFIGR